MNHEEELAEALRALLEYTGGSDTKPPHPIALAYRALADYDEDAERNRPH